MEFTDVIQKFVALKCGIFNENNDAVCMIKIIFCITYYLKVCQKPVNMLNYLFQVTGMYVL